MPGKADQDREARLKAALRENLRKRRARAHGARPAPEDDSGDSGPSAPAEG